jgi:hypothetical protein
VPQGHISEESGTVRKRTEDETNTVIAEVLAWFTRKFNKKWLLVFDNVDRDPASSVRDPEAYDLLEYFPGSDHGSILVTTRRARFRHLGEELQLGKVDDQTGAMIIRNELGGSLGGNLPTSPTVAYD